MYFQYEMKSVFIINIGDLIFIKGGKLFDVRILFQGFKKVGYDKFLVSKIFKKDKGDIRLVIFVSRLEKIIDVGDFGKIEILRKEKFQIVEEIMIFLDGSSEKIFQQKDDEVLGFEFLFKFFIVFIKLKNKIFVFGLLKKKKVGRFRLRLKLFRVLKLLGQGKSFVQLGSSFRGRGRFLKDKSLLKIFEKKKEIKNIFVFFIMEEMFVSDVLDLFRKLFLVLVLKESMEKKFSDVDLLLDLSKGKEFVFKFNRGRGRLLLSLEKKRVREMNIDLCIEAVLKKILEEGEQE